MEQVKINAHENDAYINQYEIEIFISLKNLNIYFLTLRNENPTIIILDYIINEIMEDNGDYRLSIFVKTLVEIKHPNQDNYQLKNCFEDIVIH
ncbi:MAG: hypothetical protein ACFFAS_20450 [Promethearchaeota archaeon]